MPLLIFPPRKISPLKEKNKCLPRPWAAPLSQLCAAINESDQYNTTSPSPGRGSPGPGVSAGPIDSQLGQAPAASRSAQRLRQPTTPNPGAARSSCQGPAPATLSREYSAHLKAAAPQAPVRHWPMRPLDPRPNTKESSLQSISPMFGSAVQERAMAGVTQGRKSCSCLPVDGITLLPRIPVAWRKAGILRTSPGLHDVGYYYDQANLASFLHRLVKSSICRANSFYYILILFSLLSLCFDSFISSSHRCVSRERKAHFWESLHW